ncbi:hypothetical protein EPO15_12630 [bacterium]|nr:MAG: hypothetical protein EPO15_12630 [bacterium]
MPRRRDLSERGAVLVGVILLLVIMAILVPAMVLLVQRESNWSVKNQHDMSAFHHAEGGIEKGYRAITASTGTWYALIEDGTGIERFLWDHKFTDIDGGHYAVGISSGPEERQATIVAIGQDQKGRQTRALKAIYAQNTLGDIAIQAMDGVQVAGGVQVEWGAIVGPDYLDAGGRTYPQFWSAAGTSFDNDPSPPNCDQPDCCQWFSFNPDVPPDPGIDLAFYRSSAVAGGSYYSTAQSWSSFDYTDGGVVFVENNLTVGSPGVNVVGTLLVTGNLSTTSGAWGKGSATMTVPRTAWKQYCNNWSHYKSEDFDATEPTDFPGLDSTYLSPDGATWAPTPNGKFAVQGFMYVGGAFSTSGGGGNAFIYGNMLAQGSVTIAANSGVTVYYNKESASAIRTKKVNLRRVLWQDQVLPWPAGL